MRMNWTHIWDILSDKVSAALSFAFVAVWAYFESTYTFIIAFLFAFAINIVAGFRADEVKIKLARVQNEPDLIDKLPENIREDVLKLLNEMEVQDEII